MCINESETLWFWKVCQQFLAGCIDYEFVEFEDYEPNLLMLIQRNEKYDLKYVNLQFIFLCSN